jgi:glucuronoarabinoxylan endo-1,4-beta-xylanase
VIDGNPSSVDVATAKAAIAAGAIVFASPWNAAKTYTSADFSAYATHLNNFVSYMKGQGVDLYAISVQNEPDYGSQAGWGSWSAAACHDFVLNYGASITTKLMSCESFNYQKSYYDPILNDSAALANVGVFGTHLYGTAVSAYAYPLWNSKGAGKEMWMTEHYTNSNTDANQWPDALGVASEMHNVMVTGQMNAYVFWPIKRSYGPINGGAVTKRGGCMGQWSKFVRPGFHRVDATASPGTGLSLSAYAGDTGLVVIVVNTGSASTLSISIPGTTISSFAKYTTSSSKTLASDGTVTASNGSMSVPLDGSSVTSLVGSGDPGGGGTSGTGGATSTGGSTSAAGASSTGGSKTTGGATGAGGSTNVARTGTGGSSKATTGGATSTGGTTGAAGTRPTGGAPGVGGSLATGGTSGSGGSKAAGGTKAAGGSTSATGGSVSTGGKAPGIGGNDSGGAPGAGGSSSVAGGNAPATGGLTAAASVTNSSQANTGVTIQDPMSTDTGSCSCRVNGERSRSRPLALLGMLGVFALGSLRRRKHSGR